MDFAQQQRNPAKHLVGLSVVVVLHIIVVYALVTGLARKVVEVIKQPLETKIIEEIKKPLDDLPPPPPKLLPPPPPFVPPPEISIQAPAISTGAITTVTTTKPPPPVIRPVEAPKPAVRRGVVPTRKVDPTYPRQAIKDGIEGSVEAMLTISPSGDVIRVDIVKSHPPRVFDAAAITAMMQWKFRGDGSQFVGIVEIDFKLND